MKHILILAMSMLTTVGMHLCKADTEPPSEFNESTIRTIQDAWDLTPEFRAFVEEFDASNDPLVKSAKWEEAVVAASEGILSASWTPPAGGWKLLDFPAQGNLSVQQVVDQPWLKASNTKIVAQNETEAVRLRGAGALLLNASIEGGQWGEKLLLDIAQRPDGNLKRLAFWFTRNFGQDVNAIAWSPDWSAWQQAYTSANALGKAIILRNLTMLAVKTNEFSVASNIYVSALSGSDRELKAIALVFSHPALGSAVTQKWNEIADNGSDPQFQALANEMKSTFGIE